MDLEEIVTLLHWVVPITLFLIVLFIVIIFVSSETFPIIQVFDTEKSFQNDS